jgi:DNA-binding response OmpR family regulator
MYLLIIEDNAEDALLMHQALATVENCQSYVCRSAAEAKAYLEGAGRFYNRRKHPFPDAILTDVNLGAESGVQFVRWMRCHKDYLTLPTFILSNSPSDHDIAAARELGVMRVMKKPVELRILERTLAQVVEELLQRAPIHDPVAPPARAVAPATSVSAN